MLFSEIKAPLRMIDRLPIKTLSLIVMGVLGMEFLSLLCLLFSGDTAWKSVSEICVSAPIKQFIPIEIHFAAHMLPPLMPVSLPIEISALGCSVLNTVGWFTPRAVKRLSEQIVTPSKRIIREFGARLTIGMP